jgi:hypothetical protein
LEHLQSPVRREGSRKGRDRGPLNGAPASCVPRPIQGSKPPPEVPPAFHRQQPNPKQQATAAPIPSSEGKGRPPSCVRGGGDVRCHVRRAGTGVSGRSARCCDICAPEEDECVGPSRTAIGLRAGGQQYPRECGFLSGVSASAGDTLERVTRATVLGAIGKRTVRRTLGLCPRLIRAVALLLVRENRDGLSDRMRRRLGCQRDGPESWERGVERSGCASAPRACRQL